MKLSFLRWIINIIVNKWIVYIKCDEYYGLEEKKKCVEILFGMNCIKFNVYVLLLYVEWEFCYICIFRCY